jgi:hypothetical protein
LYANVGIRRTFGDIGRTSAALGAACTRAACATLAFLGFDWLSLAFARINLGFSNVPGWLSLASTLAFVGFCAPPVRNRNAAIVIHGMR